MLAGSVVVVPPAVILNREQIEEIKDSKLGDGFSAEVRVARLVLPSDYKQVAIKRNKTVNYEQEVKELLAFASPPPHANIVRFMGIVPSESHLEFVMELAEGGSLQALLKDKTRAAELRSSQRRVSRMLQGVLCALDHLHSRSFIHRDLAARNVLLSSRDDSSPQIAKLADWGVLFGLVFFHLIISVSGLTRDVSKSAGVYKYRVDEFESWTIMVSLRTALS